MDEPTRGDEPIEASAPSAPDDETQSAETLAKGPNLILLYSLLALGLLAAMGFAAAIVWPFYKTR